MPGRFIRYFKGYVRIRIDSHLPERFLNLCAFHHIVLWGLTPGSGTDGQVVYEMYMSIRDFFRIRDIVRKTKTKVTVTGHYGMPFFFQKYKSRKLFIPSVCLCVLFIYLLTLFIWQIEISGLERHSPSEILEFLEQEQIRYGMRKSKVDCGYVESSIRAQFPDIVWVAASLEGTNLHIQIKENVENFEQEETPEGTADIVSDDSGTVVEMVTRTGTPMTSVGQQVEAGQVLISGREAHLDDSGTVTGYSEGYADGDIRLQTVLSYEDRFPYEHQVQVPQKRVKRNLTLWIFGKKFQIFSGKPKFPFYKKETTKKTLVIGSSFYLPVVYELTLMREYENHMESYSKEEAKALANENFRRFTEDLAKKGVEIIENNVKIVLMKGECVTTGTLTVIKSTGTHVPMKSLEDTAPGETSPPQGQE